MCNNCGCNADPFAFNAEKKNCGCGQDPCVTYGAESELVGGPCEICGEDLFRDYDDSMGDVCLSCYYEERSKQDDEGSEYDGWLLNFAESFGAEDFNRKAVSIINYPDRGERVNYQLSCGHNITVENDWFSGDAKEGLGEEWECFECMDSFGAEGGDLYIKTFREGWESLGMAKSRTWISGYFSSYDAAMKDAKEEKDDYEKSGDEILRFFEKDGRIIIDAIGEKRTTTIIYEKSRKLGAESFGAESEIDRLSDESYNELSDEMDRYNKHMDEILEVKARLLKENIDDYISDDPEQEAENDAIYEVFSKYYPDIYGAESFAARGTYNLYKSQEKVLKAYRDSGGKENHYDSLPLKIVNKLESIRNSETLWSNVNMWLWDNPSTSKNPYGGFHSSWDAESFGALERDDLIETLIGIRQKLARQEGIEDWENESQGSIDSLSSAFIQELIWYVDGDRDTWDAESFVLKTDSGHEVEWDDGSFYMAFKEPIDGYGVVSGHWYGGEKESPNEFSLDVEPAWDEENEDDYDVPPLYIHFDNVEYYGIRNHNMTRQEDRVLSPELSGAIQEGVAWMVADHADKTVVSREYKGESFGAEDRSFEVRDLEGNTYTLKQVSDVQLNEMKAFGDDRAYNKNIFFVDGMNGIAFYEGDRASWFGGLDYDEPKTTVIDEEGQKYDMWEKYLMDEIAEEKYMETGRGPYGFDDTNVYMNYFIMFLRDSNDEPINPKQFGFNAESFGAEYGKRQRFGNRYVGRDTKGKFISNVSVGRSLKADRRTKSKTPARSGFGHKGDTQKGASAGFKLPTDAKSVIGIGAVLGGLLAYLESKA